MTGPVDGKPGSGPAADNRYTRTNDDVARGNGSTDIQRLETLAEVNENFLVAAAEGQPLEDVYVLPELVNPETAKNFYVGNVRH